MNPFVVFTMSLRGHKVAEAISKFRREITTLAFSFLAMTFLFVSSPVFALELGLAREDGGQAGTSLNFAASARSLGMGRAHTGLADDASAPYWNPAGLSQVTRKDIVALYSAMELETNYGFFSYAQPAANYGVFGVGLVSLRSGNFEKRTGPLMGDHVGTFDISETALLLSHGIKFRPKWAVGESVKVIREEIDRYTGTGVGLDGGLMWAFSSKWQTGLMIKNLVAPRLKLKSATDEYPRELRLGIKWHPHNRVILATDLYQVEKANLKASLGAEWRPYPLMALRTGLNDTEVTAGLGFQFGDWDFDYAIGYNVAAPAGTEGLGESHRFGIHLSFGRNIVAEEEALSWQRKGQQILARLRATMESDEIPDSDEVKKLLEESKMAIQYRAYPDPKDLYLAQGYNYFFERKYNKSTDYLGEALNLTKTKDEDLERHFQKAKRNLSEAETLSVINLEFRKAKEAFSKGDYRTVVFSCMKILKFDPDQVEAKPYLEMAEKRIQEPIFLAIKIAKTKMNKGQYLEAIRTLTDLQKFDPQNKTAAELIEQSIRALEENQGNDSSRFVVEVTPDQAKSREFYSQGLLLYSKGDLKGAIKAWESSLKFNGKNQAARNAYNRVLIEFSDK